MENIIQSVSIKNFKSIKELDFECKKVNVFIGKPNVGKSNILEAMSLFAFPMAEGYGLNQFIRLKKMNNLFYDNNSNNKTEVKISIKETNDLTAFIKEKDFSVYEFFIGDKSYFEMASYQQYLDTRDSIAKSRGSAAQSLEIKDKNFNKSVYLEDFNPDGTNKAIQIPHYQNPIRNYHFTEGIKFNYKFRNFLLPPDGRNLVTILQGNNSLLNEIQGFFEEYGFELLIDVDKNEFEIQKRVEKRVYKYPFELMADTLQRIIFYLAAIESNGEAAIIFEEPETHSFPPYISTIARRINMDQTNQFFISTHSPYLLNTLIEETDFDNLNVFITYFENYQTKLRSLENEELREILDDNIDAFFNLDRFVHSLK